MNQQKEELSLLDFIKRFQNVILYIWRKKFWILLIGFIGGLLGLVYAQYYKPVYIAELVFVTESEGSNKMGSYAGIAAQFGIDLGASGDGAFEGENLLEMTKSKTIIKNTLFSLINKKDTCSLLINEYVKSNSQYLKKMHEHNLSQFYISDKETTSRIKDSLILAIHKNIITNQIFIEKVDKKLNFTSVKFKDCDEKLAKLFVEKVTENLIEYYTDYKSAKARINYNLLEKEADSLKAVLFGNINNVAQLTDLNVNPLKTQLRTGIQHKQVDVQVASVLYTEVLKNLQLSKISLRKETPLIQIIDKPTFPLEKKKPGRLLSAIIGAFIFTCVSVFYFFCKLQLTIFKKHLGKTPINKWNGEK